MAAGVAGNREVQAMSELETLMQALRYDAETGLFWWRENRGRRYIAGTVAGSRDKDGYTVINMNRRRYRAARLAWLFVFGAWPANEVDHINRNRSDDRITNLRLATRTQNALNRRTHKKSSAVYEAARARALRIER